MSTTVDRLVVPPVPAAPAAAAGADRLARREVAVFLAAMGVLAVGTNAGAAALGADLRHVDGSPPLAQLLLFGGAFLPLVAALASRWFTGQPVRGAGWGWHRPPRRWLLAAWAAPIGYAAAAGAAVWLSGAGGFDAGGLAGQFGDGAPAVLSVVVALGAVTLGVVPFALLALGEELGWRGPLAERLSALTTPFRAALLTGLAWSLCHWPLMILVPGGVEGAPTVWAVSCFTVAITAVSFPLHRLRMRTGSVWPAVVFHAAHNAAIYFVTDPLTVEAGSTGWFAGETGVALAVASVTASVWLWRRWDTASPPPVHRERR